MSIVVLMCISYSTASATAHQAVSATEVNDVPTVMVMALMAWVLGRCV